jgi:hypothetical protein
MAENQNQQSPETPAQAPAKPAIGAKKSHFKKIPTEVLFSPAGMVLIFMAAVIEIIDLIPIPVIDQLWEIPLEIIFSIFLIILAKVPLSYILLPAIIERIPIINDIVPSYLLRLFF